MKKTIASLVLCLLMAAPVSGETSVWIARTDSSVMYLGGTIHFLRESDRPLPPEFDRAYQASDILVFETDLSQTNDPAFQAALMDRAFNADGQTLDQVLSVEAYEDLEEYCTGKGVPIASLSQYKPWAAMMSLLAMELQQRGVYQEGVDASYHAKAVADNKDIKELESIEEQIELVTTMADEDESAFVLYGVDELKNLAERFDKLVTAWKTGDAKAMYTMMSADMERKFPELYKRMFVDRNMDWLPAIVECLATPETEFVLVGSGHLVGEDGVINQLETLGYEIEIFK